MAPKGPEPGCWPSQSLGHGISTLVLPPQLIQSPARQKPGELAQLVERCDRTAEVRGSSPLFSISGARRCRSRLLVELFRRPCPLRRPAAYVISVQGFPLCMDWQPEAEQQLKEVPFFVRPIVRKRIEKLAEEAGLSSVDTAFYQQSKAKFGEK